MGGLSRAACLAIVMRCSRSRTRIDQKSMLSTLSPAPRKRFSQDSGFSQPIVIRCSRSCTGIDQKSMLSTLSPAQQPRRPVAPNFRRVFCGGEGGGGAKWGGPDSPSCLYRHFWSTGQTICLHKILLSTLAPAQQYRKLFTQHSGFFHTVDQNDTRQPFTQDSAWFHSVSCTTTQKALCTRSFLSSCCWLSRNAGKPCAQGAMRYQSRSSL